MGRLVILLLGVGAVSLAGALVFWGERAPADGPAGGAQAEQLLEPGWDTLASYYYHQYEDEKRGTIPDAIQALDGKRVKVTGHMIPVEVTPEGKVASFILSRWIPECCFGGPPKVNEWIVVTVANPEGVDHVLLTVGITGKLTVGEEKNEFGEIGSLYRMTADDVRVEKLTDHELNAEIERQTKLQMERLKQSKEQEK